MPSRQLWTSPAEFSPAKSALHWTNKGRVVYDRKRHLMSLNDVLRIMRFVLRNSRDSRGNREQPELHNDFLSIFKDLVYETQLKYGYNPTASDKIATSAIADVLWSMIIGHKIEEVIPETERYKEETSGSQQPI